MKKSAVVKRSFTGFFAILLVVTIFVADVFADEAFFGMIKAGRWADAVKYADNKLPNRTGPVWAALGLAHENLNAPKEALNCYQRSFLMDMMDANALEGIARTAMKLGDVERARSAAEAALRSNPKSVVAMDILAICTAESHTPAPTPAPYVQPAPAPVVTPAPMPAPTPSSTSTRITFTSPTYVTQSNYRLLACITSPRAIDQVFVTVNGSAQRGISVARYDNCDHSVDQSVTLTGGENHIRIEVSSGGVNIRETHVVNYAASSAPAPVSDNAIDGRRVALVIGNAGYSSAPLKNPKNDANAVSAKLKALGFDVTSLTDADNRGMKGAIANFAGKASGAAIALFYYSGHGVQHNGNNYLLPVNIGNMNNIADVEDDGTSMNRVMNALDDSKAQVKIVMLDACRNNPFVRSSGGGLAAASRTPRGTFIAYSTAPGEVALDGAGQNSPFTTSFLKHADAQGLRIEDLFKRIITDVRQTTGGSQSPWTSSNMEGDFYFKR